MGGSAVTCPWQWSEFSGAAALLQRAWKGVEAELSSSRSGEERKRSPIESCKTNCKLVNSSFDLHHYRQVPPFHLFVSFIFLCIFLSQFF